MSMRHLGFLRYVDEVARAGSIRKAAEQLNVTSSAVNRRMMDLEEELGAPLFERRPRGVRLTAAGRIVRALCPRAIVRRRAHESQIEDLKGLRRGTVRIACSQALALEFLPREIAAYRAQLSARAFRGRVLDHERAMTSLAEYEVDLVLVFRPPYLANFRPLMAFEQRLVALMPANHPLAAKHRFGCAIASRYPVALRSAESAAVSCSTRRWRGTKLRFDIVGQSNSFEFLRHGDARQCDLVPDRHRRLRTRRAASSRVRSTSATRHVPIWCSGN